MSKYGIKNFISKRAELTFKPSIADKMIGRQTGKSTGVCLALIGLAMQNPKKPVLILESGNTAKMNRYLRHRVVNIIKCLGLEGFKILHKTNSLVYDYEPSQETLVK